MTASSSWRLALGRTTLGMALVLTLQLSGCYSPPKDEATIETAERLYKEAREDIDSGTYERAIKTLERIEGLAAGSLLAQQALLEVAYLQWKSGDRASALTAVDRFIKLNPSSPALDYALYLRGVVNFNDNLGVFGIAFGQDVSERDQAASREAYQSFKQLSDQFPNSRYAPDARARMAHIVNSLASYEVHVARYYLRRGAYLAAAARAQQAVTEYQQTPAIEEALYILVQSYDRLGLTQLRDDAERVMRSNFPDSPFYGGGGSRDKPWWKFW